MIVIAINNKKSLDMFESLKKFENINDGLTIMGNFFQSGNVSGRTD